MRQRSSDTPVSRTSSDVSTCYASNRSSEGINRNERYQSQHASIGNRTNPKLFTESENRILSGLDRVGSIVNGRLYCAFSALKSLQVIRRNDKCYLKPILQSQCEASSSGTRQRSRSIVTRHHRAEELLESLPVKYKKKMRQMIEDYETERIDLIKQLKHRTNETSSIGNELQKEQLLGRIYQLERENQELQSGFQQILCAVDPNSQQLKESAENMVRNILAHLAGLQNTIAQSIVSVRKDSSATGKQFQQSSNSAANRDRARQRTLEMKPLGPRPSISPQNFARRQKTQEDAELSANISKICLSVRHTTPKDSTVHDSDSEEEFGKEKVIEKKRIRRLLKQVMESTADSMRKERLELLAAEVGLDTQIYAQQPW